MKHLCSHSTMVTFNEKKPQHHGYIQCCARQQQWRTKHILLQPKHMFVVPHVCTAFRLVKGGVSSEIEIGDGRGTVTVFISTVQDPVLAWLPCCCSPALARPHCQLLLLSLIMKRLRVEGAPDGPAPKRGRKRPVGCYAVLQCIEVSFLKMIAPNKSSHTCFWHHECMSLVFVCPSSLFA